MSAVYEGVGVVVMNVLFVFSIVLLIFSCVVYLLQDEAPRLWRFFKALMYLFGIAFLVVVVGFLAQFAFVGALG